MTLALWLWGCAHRSSPPNAPRDPGPVPELAMEWYAHAALAAERGDAAEARRAAGWLLRVDGDRAWTWLAAARVWAQIGDDVAAADAARTACRLDPALDAEIRASGWAGCASVEVDPVR